MDDHVLNGSEAASMNETTLSTGGGVADQKDQTLAEALATTSTLIDVTKFVLRIGYPEQLIGLLSTYKYEFMKPGLFCTCQT